MGLWDWFYETFGIDLLLVLLERVWNLIKGIG